MAILRAVLASLRVRHFDGHARFNDEKVRSPNQNARERESIGNFEFTFQSVNDDGQSCVAIFPLRFSELDPSNSPVRVFA